MGCSPGLQGCFTIVTFLLRHIVTVWHRVLNFIYVFGGGFRCGIR